MESVKMNCLKTTQKALNKMSSKQPMHHISNYDAKEMALYVTLAKALRFKAKPIVWEQDDVMNVLHLMKFLH